MSGAETPRDLDQEFEAAARQLFTPEFRTYGEQYLRELTELVAAGGKSQETQEVLSTFTIHKSTDELRGNPLPNLEPISINRAGFFNEGFSEVESELQSRGILQTRPSSVSSFDQHVYEVPEWVRSQLSIRDAVVSQLEEFLDSVDPRSFFQKHDKTRVYPRVTDESRVIGTDWSLVNSLQNHSGIIDDPRLHHMVVSRDIALWEADCDSALKPVIVPLYIIGKRFKNIWTAPEDTVPGITDDPAYNRRKTNISPWVNNVDDVHFGEVGYWNGMLDATSMTAEDATNDIKQFREHPACSETIPIRFDGTPDIPEQRLYDLSLGVLGVIIEHRGQPLIQAISLTKNGALPESIQAEQTKALSRLQFQLDQRLLNGQAELEETLRNALEEGDIPNSDRWLVFEILARIRDAQTIEELIGEIASHSETERIIELIVQATGH